MNRDSVRDMRTYVRYKSFMEKYLLGFGSVYSLGASLVPNDTKELTVVESPVEIHFCLFLLMSMRQLESIDWITLPPKSEKIAEFAQIL